MHARILNALCTMYKVKMCLIQYFIIIDGINWVESTIDIISCKWDKFNEKNKQFSRNRWIAWFVANWLCGIWLMTVFSSFCLGCCIPQRVILAIMCFLAIAIAYVMRVCLSVAIVEMVVPVKTVVTNTTKADHGLCPADPPLVNGDKEVI